MPTSRPPRPRRGKLSIACFRPAEALGNGRGDQQRRNAHIPRQAHAHAYTTTHITARDVSVMQALRPDPKPTPSLGPCTRSFSVDIPGQALRRTLLRGLAEGTVQWGRRLQAYEEDADGVTLRFAGGDEARAAVLVGCDGIWSAILHPLTPPLPSLSLPSLSHHPTPPHPHQRPHPRPFT